MADFETKLRWLSERGNPIGAEDLIERIEADLAGDPLVVAAKRREGTLMTKTRPSPTAKQPSRYRGPAWALAALVASLAVAGMYLALSGNSGQVAEPTLTTVAEPAPTTVPALPTSDAAVTELLKGFLGARISGKGAEDYLSVSGETTSSCCNTPPLLYATTSGAPYERAEFEPVLGIEWPYEQTAFKVRLFAGDTVVEQLFFAHDPTKLPADDPLRLVYNSYGFGTEIAPTTEDGEPVAVPYTAFEGQVTVHVAHPWVFSDYSPGGRLFGRLIPEGQVAPTTDGGQRNDWDQLIVMSDPVLSGPGCRTASPQDTAALAESIQSYPGIEVTRAATVTAGGDEALMMDVGLAAGASIRVAVDNGYNPCPNGLLSPILNQKDGSLITAEGEGVIRGGATGERMRLYLFDVPDGSSMRILAVAIVAPEQRFERAVAEAAPVVASIEFHTP